MHELTYALELHGVAVGRSRLEHADRAANRATGAFRPGAGFPLVRDVFLLYQRAVPQAGGPVQDAELLERYYRARNALGLTLSDPDGRRVRTDTIHIFQPPNGKGWHIEVYTTDRPFWMARRD